MLRPRLLLALALLGAVALAAGTGLALRRRHGRVTARGVRGRVSDLTPERRGELARSLDRDLATVAAADDQLTSLAFSDDGRALFVGFWKGGVVRVPAPR